jgi:hypothetical protein
MIEEVTSDQRLIRDTDGHKSNFKLQLAVSSVRMKRQGDGSGTRVKETLEKGAEELFKIPMVRRSFGSFIMAHR